MEEHSSSGKREILPLATTWMILKPLLLLLSHFSRVRLRVTPWTAPHEAPPSLGFSGQEHWSGLPFPSPVHETEKWKWSYSVVSGSSQPHGLQPTRLLHPWDFPGKSTGVGCHCLLCQAIMLSQINQHRRTNTARCHLHGASLVVQWWRICLQCRRPGFCPLGKGMTTHSTTLAWRIPWVEEPGGLQSIWLQWVRTITTT